MKHKMEELEMKKPITPILKNMKVGETEAWPIERLDTVRISEGRVAAIKRREGWKYKMRINGLVVEVTRLA